MNRTFTLCFLLYPIALPFGYVLVYTFYHYAVPDANSNFYMIDDATEHIESVYSLFRNNISVWGAFKNLIGGNADSTFGNGHFSAYIMRDAAGAVYTAIIISKWLGDVWSMIFTTYDDVKIIKKLS